MLSKIVAGYMRYTLVLSVIVAAGYLAFAWSAAERLARGALVLAGLMP